MLDVAFSYVVHFLTGDFPFSSELQGFFMAYQGHLMVRSGINKDLHMNWFHAFMLGVVSAFGGATFAPLWLGRPSSTLSNDLNLFFLIVTYILTYYTPFDIGYKFGNLFPVSMLCTVFSQLFRTMGVVGYVNVGYQTFKDRPSEYYPIPVFGPIVWATLLGNMSSFFTKGFHGHLQNGMPWPFQNGLFCATFYHFYVNDGDGLIGNSLRTLVRLIPGVQMGLDDQTFAVVIVSAFMQTCGILQMPELFGPSFSPFVIIQNQLKRGMVWVTSSSATQISSRADEGEPVDGPGTSNKSKARSRNKSKTKTQ